MAQQVKIHTALAENPSFVLSTHLTGVSQLPVTPGTEDFFSRVCRHLHSDLHARAHTHTRARARGHTHTHTQTQIKNKIHHF